MGSLKQYFSFCGKKSQKKLMKSEFTQCEQLEFIFFSAEVKMICGASSKLWSIMQFMTNLSHFLYMTEDHLKWEIK